MQKKKSSFKEFLKRKDIEISAKRYGIDALGAMAQGLFVSLLIGTIIATLGTQLGIDFLVTIGNFCKNRIGTKGIYPADVIHSVTKADAYFLALSHSQGFGDVIGVVARKLYFVKFAQSTPIARVINKKLGHF